MWRSEKRRKSSNKKSPEVISIIHFLQPDVYVCVCTQYNYACLIIIFVNTHRNNRTKEPLCAKCITIMCISISIRVDQIDRDWHDLDTLVSSGRSTSSVQTINVRHKDSSQSSSVCVWSAVLIKATASTLSNEWNIHLPKRMNKIS